jgi:NhaP-type Na+/H+ and K+/H+ antiporter
VAVEIKSPKEIEGIRAASQMAAETLVMVGDRLRAHGVELVVRAVEKGVITRVGLKLHD